MSLIRGWRRQNRDSLTFDSKRTAVSNISRAANSEADDDTTPTGRIFRIAYRLALWAIRRAKRYTDAQISAGISAIELAKRIERRHHADSTTDIRKLKGRLKKLQELAATGCRNTQWSLLNPGTFVIPQNEWYIVPFNTEVLHGYGAELGWKYKPEIVGSSHLSAFLYLEVSGAVDSYKIHLAVFKNGEYHLPLSVRCAWKPTDGNAFYELGGVARVFHECGDEIDIRVRYDVSLGDSIQKPGNLYKVVGHVEAGYDHCCGSQPIESHGDYITTISLP